MQISYNWMKDYCEHDLPPQALADALSHSGLCVETYEPRDGDWMLDVEVTSNRPDCLSHLGIAREIAALTCTKASPPERSKAIEREDEQGKSASVEVESPELCPHYTAKLLKNVKVGASPKWMQDRLVTCGLRPVNNIVDITNYVLLESGQPMHPFDLTTLSENRIVVRRAEKGERITTIDGTECSLSEDMCVIADAAKPVAVAGIMGGLDTEINENTTDVLLESARFNPANIRRTSRKLGLSSDSSYRFERGVDPENIGPASERAAAMIADLAGADVITSLADIRADSPPAREVTMRFERLHKILGINVKREKTKKIFEGLGLTIVEQGRDSIKVAVPSRRPDLTREIDLIEEVARINGYDKIPETTRIPIAIAPRSKTEVCKRRAKKMLAGQGFDEVITSSLISSPAQRFEQPWHDGEPIPLRNPVSSDKTHLRPSLMKNLLDAKRHNQAHEIPEVDLFETGKIYIPVDKDLEDQPQEKECLCVLTDRENGFFVLKGLLKNLLSSLHIPESSTCESPGNLDLFADGKSLFCYIDDRFLGCIGETDRKIANHMDFTTRPALMELDVDLLLDYASIDPELRPLPRYPAVKRDIAVVVDENVRWADIKDCVWKNAPAELEYLDFLDLYRGDQVPKGKKSVAFTAALRSPKRTLTSHEADGCRDEIVSALAETHEAHLRE